jgi:hypothetical protein
MKINLFHFALAGLLMGGMGSTARAQEADPAVSSQLTGIKLPANAVRLRAASTPPDVNKGLASLIEAGGASVKKGRSEVIAWTGAGYSKSKSKNMMSQLAASMKAAGWQYEIESPAEARGEFSVLRALKEKPTRRAVVGYWIPSDEVLVLAWVEMLAANKPAVETPAPPAEEEPEEEPEPKPVAAKGDTATLNASLAEAIEAKEADKVKELIGQGASGKGRTKGGQTFLMRAVMGGNAEIVGALLEAGANPEIGGNESGETPLFIASLLGEEEIAALLIEKGADINSQIPDSGLTPLHGAVIGSKTRMVQKLLEAGADPKVKDKSGKTARQSAERSKATEMVELLKEAEEKAE